VLQFFLTPFYLSSQRQRAPRIEALFLFSPFVQIFSARDPHHLEAAGRPLQGRGGIKNLQVHREAPKTAGASFATKEEL
jgi:hypothetical protein